MANPPITDLLAASAAELGELDEPTTRAVLLVAIAHDTRDRNVWGGDRAITYWDRLPERVRAGCYGGPTLAHWWERMGRLLGCGQPYKVEDRRALAQELVAGNDEEVLDVLRTRAEMVCLRVRLAIQARRDARRAAAETDHDEKETL